MKKFATFHSAVFLASVMAICMVPATALAQDTNLNFQHEQIAPPDCLQISQQSNQPCTSAELAAWMHDMQHWRMERRIRMGFDPSQYQRPELQWTASSFIQPQMMVQDRYFYDPVTRKYTVDRYLNDLEKRYGGIDSVLIWHTYPNIGIDNRNQYDMLRSMPGGLDGVRQMVADFHRHHVQVLFPIMLWDQGTRDEGKPNWVATAEMMRAIGADGINGDTLDGIPLAFSKAADAVGHPLALEPEVAPGHDEMLIWNTMSWGYWEYPYAPWVSRDKWLVPRHMVNVCNRWNRDKTDDLQAAFFNGVGYESWENVWGIWNGITPRDAEALRRIATIERAVAPMLISANWQPYYPTLRSGLFASKFPLQTDAVWTLVNRTQYDISGQEFAVPYDIGTRYYDLYHGVELVPEHLGNDSILRFDIEAHGYGAVLATKNPLTPQRQQLLQQMHAMTAQPLSAYSHAWNFLPQTILPIQPTKPPVSAPADMIKIPAADFNFRVNGVEIEGDNDIGVDVQYPWENSPRRFHNHTIHIASFWIDTYPVTNAEFKKFLDASHYHPADNLNFLRDWTHGTYPSGWGSKPVTWVSLEDARAYAAWAGKRLPHEWEWQYAAQGNDGRTYPWGNAWDASAVPVPDKGRTLRGPDSVESHAKGASPFGVMDLVGNVWQWTEEFQDDHTRAAILRGGSYYQPQGSLWYFPQAYRNNQHGKLLLMSPSMDRAATVGFRCVMDAQ
ncbi:MAG TPA: SUMF1/EgtB/PvdO family nonheme iron enzyme [Acidobacteriaceae bacterium]|jgi:formylglycine-generating enzyme required for sulfatase activity|nr:SUMF1/EgtB/PvdO family nonheme iron enzyme [Acidobacteriaceae bacterium]